MIVTEPLFPFNILHHFKKKNTLLLPLGLLRPTTPQGRSRATESNPSSSSKAYKDSSPDIVREHTHTPTTSDVWSPIPDHKMEM
jgi:hypothetical protein